MYGKIFASMYEGSIYGKWTAIVTFQQMIVLADRNGVVDMTPEALSARTSIPIEIIREGLEILESPDPMSRTPDEDGRRIIRLDKNRPWGWFITNYQKYREIRTAEERREYHRQYYHNKRKHKNAQQSFNNSQQTQPIVEGEVDGSISSPKGEEGKTVVLPKYQQIVDLYHEMLPELPRIAKLTKTRKGYIRQRWVEDKMDSLDKWRRFFNHVKKSDFLMGRTQGRGDRLPFQANLEWLTKPSNFIKVYEGKYDV